MAQILTRDELIAELEQETAICKHLFEKLPADAAEYRPAPDQRSMLELLRYIAICTVVPARALAAGDWRAAGGLWGREANMAFEEFPAAMDRQMQEVRQVLAAVPDGEFSTRIVPLLTGEPPVLMGRGLVKTALKWIVAYRMQLFLYARSAGAPGLGTMNCWVGIDDPDPDWEG